MQTEKLVFDLVDSISDPVLIIENGENEKYSLCYSNKAMDKLLKQNNETAETKTEAVSDTELNAQHHNSLNALIKEYNQETRTDSCTLHDVEIFDRVYNVLFNKYQKHLFAVFTEIKFEEFLNNIAFHNLSDSCSAIVLVLDSNGKIVDMNECFLNLVGMEKEDVVGKQFFETFIPGHSEQLGQYFKDILSNDTYHQHFVTPMKGSQNNIFNINWQVSKIIKHNETYIIAVGSDISKFIKENSDLKKQLKSIKVGFNFFPLAVGYMGIDGKFTKMNPRFMKMFRINKENEHIGFDQIPIFKKNIGFKTMSEYIKLIKEMSYKIDYVNNDKPMKLKVDIRLLQGKDESSKFYIVVAQNI